MKTGRKPRNWTIEQILQYTKQDKSGCIIWQRAKGRGGYGLLGQRYKMHPAHRLLYELHHGPLPKNLVVRHKCNNPPCVNIEHLQPGTSLDNARDCNEAGRRVVGEQNNKAKLTELQVRQMRNLHASGLLPREIALQFNITSVNAWMICTRRTWKHVA